jgi:hypothetical protein
MLVHVKVLSTTDEGSKVIVDKVMDRPGAFEDIKATFHRDMPKIFPDGAFNTMEFFIEPATADQAADFFKKLGPDA